jgi:anti-sigma factor RsiW
MQSSEITNSAACPSPEISAYIDGELSPADEMRLELHIASCRMCNDDLNLQKSFLIALDSSLDDAPDIELPKDFTRSVVTNAESGVSGLRRPNELRNAALICVSLIGISLFALGSKADRTFAASAAIVEKLIAIVSSALHFVYDISLGSTIVFRSLASNFVFDSTFGVLSVLVVFVLSLFLFSKLIVRFHRT